MMYPHILRISLSLVLFCLLTIFCAATALAAGDDWKEWRPIEPAHLTLKEPVVEKDADAEALFWEVRVADELEGNTPRTVLTHYIRIKIFTERGRETQSRVDIQFGKVGDREIKIKDIAGRTIKPDGSIVDLKKEDIFERTVVKVSGIKIKVKSFAMPSVEPGAIIEYRWREVRGDHLSYYDRLEFSRSIPVQLVKYYVKPLSLPNFPLSMRARTFQGNMTPFAKEKNDFFSTTMTNVPAFREEPRMPPEYSVRPWMLVFYAPDKQLAPAKFWKDHGNVVHEVHKTSLKVNDEIRKTAAGIIGDASTPEQKLERLFDFCRYKIKNIYDDASGLTPEAVAKMKENKTPADTLKRGTGTGHDINMLFAALAAAAGFDSHVAALSDRGDTFFDPNFTDDYFMRVENIAVRVGSDWRFFDPGSTYVPHGMLRWQEEGQDALVSDSKEPVWVRTPLSPPEKSKEKRIAKLRLSDDGTLEGEVQVAYTGHFAVEMKELNDDDSPAEREEALKNKLKRRMSTAEISNVRIENVTDPVKPFMYRYQIRVPGYAQRTGKRLFLQPAFFQQGVGPLFPTSDRKNQIYFQFPWSEEDTVEIDLPDGFALDNAEAPARFGSGDLSQYNVKLSITTDKRTLIYNRQFFFGGGASSTILFPVASYGQLKRYFDEVNKQDGHTISLKQGGTEAPPSKNSSN